MRRARVRGQVAIVSTPWALTRSRSSSGKGNAPGDFDYMCRNGHILVRDRDVQRVTRALGGGQPADNLIDGVTLFALPGGLTVHDALERLDRHSARVWRLPITSSTSHPRRAAAARRPSPLSHQQGTVCPRSPATAATAPACWSAWSTPGGTRRQPSIR